MRWYTREVNVGTYEDGDIIEKSLMIFNDSNDSNDDDDVVLATI